MAGNVDARPTSGPSTLAFVRSNRRWLAAGFLMALASSFGQTFFIALFADPLRTSFELSHGAFGGLYMLATLASAVALTQLGSLADRYPADRLSVVVLFCLACSCLLLSFASSVWMLGLAIFGLRLFGQGMISHLSQTIMARWYDGARGRALAIAGLGYPTGEALMPPLAVAAAVALGWRDTWSGAAAAVLLGFTPIVAVLLLRTPTPTPRSGPTAQRGGAVVNRTRAQALKDPAFWRLAPSILAPSFIITVIFFLPAHIAEVKGWRVMDMAGLYWTFACAAVLSSILAGAAIDRFSARAALPIYFLPLAAGLFALVAAEDLAGFTLAMCLIGVSSGAVMAVHGAIWAEIYGARHLGAIKSLGHAIMVVASAIGPGVVGAALDYGVSFDAISYAMAAYLVLVSLFNIDLRRRLSADARRA